MVRFSISTAERGQIVGILSEMTGKSEWFKRLSTDFQDFPNVCVCVNGNGMKFPLWLWAFTIWEWLESISTPARGKELAIAERGWVSIYGWKFDLSLNIGDGDVHPNPS